jgi:hypothetical protein
MDIDTLELFGYIGFCSVNINSIITNKDDQLLLIGSLIATTGFLYRTYEFFQKTKYNKKFDIYIGHLILGIYNLLGFFLPINKGHQLFNIISVIGNFLLITDNKYNDLGIILLAISIMFVIYSNINKDTIDGKIKTISALCFLPFFFEELKRINSDKKIKNKL